MVNGHKYYFFDNGQMAADQYVELNYYDANGLRDRTHDVRLMGKRRPSDSEKNRLRKNWQACQESGSNDLQNQAGS